MRPHPFGEIDKLLGDLALARAHGPPEFVIHDAELGNISSDPLRFGVEARHTPTSARVLDVAHAIPDQPAYIEFVVQEPGPALYMAANRRVAPDVAVRAGNTFLVERLCD